MKTARYISVVFVVVLVGGASWSARSETLECDEITSVPATISTQGVWCFTSNLATSISTGNAIEIAVSNVTIDMNGWKLGGLAGGAGTQAQGIHAEDMDNITIRNGSVRGFAIGINLDGGQGHLIEDVRAERNRSTGIRIKGLGIMVRSNQVVDTGGSTVYDPAYGILLAGAASPRVLDNDITNVDAETSGIGIHSAISTGAIIQGNRISNVTGNTGTGNGILTVNTFNAIVHSNYVSSASDRGICLSSLTHSALIEKNVVSGSSTGIWFAATIGPPGTSAQVTGGYRDNTVVGASTPYFAGFSGVIDMGGNEP